MPHGRRTRALGLTQVPAGRSDVAVRRPVGLTAGGWKLKGANPMGRGDKRTRKGKIFRKSFGKSRPKAITTKAFVKPTGQAGA